MTTKTETTGTSTASLMGFSGREQHLIEDLLIEAAGKFRGMAARNDDPTFAAIYRKRSDEYYRIIDKLRD